MPDVKPFRGFLYNSSKVRIEDVVAPPYDVISPQMQSELYDRSEHNIVRLILNREENPYYAAAQHLRQWKEHQIVFQENQPVLYVLSQTFTLSDGTPVERRGYIGACRLEEFGKGSIYPHERTHSGPKEDRFKLFQSTKMMFSQIFGLYSDPEHILDVNISAACSSQPNIDIVFEGVRNRLWQLQDEGAVYALIELIRTQRVLIADGHHRYETALQYQNACRLKNPGHTGKEPYNFVPMFLTNMHDPGLMIFPTHRVLHDIPDFNPQQFLEKLEEYFDVEQCSSTEELKNGLAKYAQHSFGLFLAEQDHPRLLRLRDNRILSRQKGIPKFIQQLDVTVLHTVVFKQILEISEEQQEQKLYLNYEKDIDRAARSVQEHTAQAAFIMNPTRIEQVRAVSAAGTVMPQKSTYFYPKLLSGLVMYSFSS